LWQPGKLRINGTENLSDHWLEVIQTVIYYSGRLCVYLIKPFVMRLLFLFTGLFVFSNSHAQTINSRIELDKKIFLEASVKTFNPKEHKLDTCDTGQGWKMLCLIDNNLWFGSDDGLAPPRYQLNKLTITISGKKIPLDVTGMFNPTYTGKLFLKQFYLEKDQPGYALYGYFSDGAGTYMALWKIVKGRSMRLKISRDETDFR
jgi:hypothetical protein